MVFWSSDQVDELAHFGLISCFVEEFQKVDVVGFRSEVRFKEVVYSRFEHERVVDGDQADFWLFVPAGLSTTRDG